MIPSKVRVSIPRCNLVDLINLLDDVSGSLEDLQDAVEYVDPEWGKYIYMLQKYSNCFYSVLKKSDSEALYIIDFSPLFRG